MDGGVMLQAMLTAMVAILAHVIITVARNTPRRRKIFGRWNILINLALAEAAAAAAWQLMTL